MWTRPALRPKNSVAFWLKSGRARATTLPLAGFRRAFRPTIERFVKGEPAALLLVEFAGEDGNEQLR